MNTENIETTEETRDEQETVDEAPEVEANSADEAHEAEVNPTDEELNFWRDVFKTFAEINGTKVKSDKQIIKWLKNPHSDSAEYKMWGNGVCLNVVIFVLSRIVKYAQ